MVTAGLNGYGLQKAAASQQTGGAVSGTGGDDAVGRGGREDRLRSPADGGGGQGRQTRQAADPLPSTDRSAGDQLLACALKADVAKGGIDKPAQAALRRDFMALDDAAKKQFLTDLVAKQPPLRDAAAADPSRQRGPELRSAERRFLRDTSFGRFVDETFGHPLALANEKDGVPVSPLSGKALTGGEVRAAREAIAMDLAGGGAGKLARTVKAGATAVRQADRLAAKVPDAHRLPSVHSRQDAARGFDTRDVAGHLTDTVRQGGWKSVKRTDPVDSNADQFRDFHGRIDKAALKDPFHAPNDPAYPVYEVETTRDTANYVRLVPEATKGDPTGEWIMRRSDYDAIMKHPDGPQILKDKYALPSAPKYVSTVRIPPGEKLQMGVAKGNPKWGNGGGVQFRINPQRPFKPWFSTSQPFGYSKR